MTENQSTENMKYLLTIIILTTIVNQQTNGQGCVAIRGTGNTCTMQHPGDMKNESGWLLNANNRYFKSFRHFVGTTEQKHRAERHTEVINHAYALDLTLTRILNHRWSLSLGLPIVANGRSSLYEHGGKSRHSTHSFGMGDVRFSAYAWLINPLKSLKGNIQVGLGIKLPTGDYKYQDYFYTDSSKALGPVDQSIQLGDGGTGFSTEVNAYHNFSRFIGV